MDMERDLIGIIVASSLSGICVIMAVLSLTLLACHRIKSYKRKRYGKLLRRTSSKRSLPYSLDDHKLPLHTWSSKMASNILANPLHSMAPPFVMSRSKSQIRSNTSRTHDSMERKSIEDNNNENKIIFIDNGFPVNDVYSTVLRKGSKEYEESEGIINFEPEIIGDNSRSSGNSKSFRRGERYDGEPVIRTYYDIERVENKYPVFSPIEDIHEKAEDNLPASTPPYENFGVGFDTGRTRYYGSDSDIRSKMREDKIQSSSSSYNKRRRSCDQVTFKIPLQATPLTYEYHSISDIHRNDAGRRISRNHHHMTSISPPPPLPPRFTSTS